MTTKKSKRGRKSPYSPQLLEKICEYARIGVTEAEICKKIGISSATFYEWKNVHPEMPEALSKAKENVDDLVVSALWKRAQGYSHPSEKVFLSKNGKVVRVKTIEHYPPDATSCIFWLKNRRPKEWRDTSKLEFQGDLNMPQIVVSLPSNGKEAPAPVITTKDEKTA